MEPFLGDKGPALSVVMKFCFLSREKREAFCLFLSDPRQAGCEAYCCPSLFFFLFLHLLFLLLMSTSEDY